MTQIRPLVVLDCDSTSIEQEIIDLLADKAGRGAAVAAITESAMRGECDFEQSLRARVKLLAGLPKEVFSDVAKQVTFSAGFEKLITLTHAAEGKVCVVSGGFMEVLDIILPNKMVDRWHANRLEIKDGMLTGELLGEPVTAALKAEFLTRWSAEFNIPMQHTIAVGDGANDLEMMRIAAVSVAFNAKPAVQETADYCITDTLASVANLFTTLDAR